MPNSANDEAQAQLVLNNSGGRSRSQTTIPIQGLAGDVLLRLLQATTSAELTEKSAPMESATDHGPRLHAGLGPGRLAGLSKPHYRLLLRACAHNDDRRGLSAVMHLTKNGWCFNKTNGN